MSTQPSSDGPQVDSTGCMEGQPVQYFLQAGQGQLGTDRVGVQVYGDRETERKRKMKNGLPCI